MTDRPKTCPRCGAKFHRTFFDTRDKLMRQYECRSSFNDATGNGDVEGFQCIRRQRDQLRELVQFINPDQLRDAATLLRRHATGLVGDNEYATHAAILEVWADRLES